MKKILSFFAVFLTVTLLSVGALAEGNITEIRSDVGGAVGDVIERAVYGSIIHVTGTGFRNTQGDRFVRMEFSSPEVFHKDLTVLSWSRTDIRVQIPSMESFPASCHSISVTGNIMIMDSEGPFSDSISFTVAPPIPGVAATRVREELSRARIPGAGGEEEEPEVVFSPAPLTAQPVKQPERYEVATKYEAFTFPSRDRVEIEARQPSLTFYLPPFIDSVSPGEFSPGELITITGRNFSEQESKILTVYFTYEPEGISQSFYMDLYVPPGYWEPTRIRAIVPGWDSNSFRLSPYEERGALPASLRDYVSRYYIQGKLRIINMPDTRISNEKIVRLSPVVIAPEITYAADKVTSGGDLWLYGMGFGETRGTSGRIVYKKGLLSYFFGRENTFNVDHWESTAIKVQIPSSLEAGTYYVCVIDAAGVESNRVRVEVSNITLDREIIDKTKVQQRLLKPPSRSLP